MRACRVLRTRWILAAGAIVALASMGAGEASAQMHGVPGAPQARMGGMGGSGVPRPMAGSSVPMMGRQGPVRQGPSVSAAPQGNRFSGRFRSSTMTGQFGGGAGTFTGGRTAEAVKSQAKSMGRGGFGF